MTTTRIRTGWVVFILLALTAALFFSGCSEKSSDDREMRSRLVMDTKVDVTLFGVSSQEATAVANEMFEEMERLENILSRHISGSDISRINDAAGKNWVSVEPETVDVLKESIAAAELTEGVFDPTVGILLRLWGFGTEDPKVPSPDELEHALQLVGYDYIQIDEENNKVFLTQPGMNIDVGGIAKGYVVDRGQDVTAEAEIKAVFINAGGDISIRGSRPQGGKWRVAIQDPDNPQEWIAIIEMEEGSIATSGDYQRFFEQEGVIYHHILDPFTGFPARHVTSVTVTGPSTSMVDALTTGIFVLGVERGLDLLEALPGYEGLIVDNDGELYITAGLEDDVEIL